jgi:hypothetical protein
MDSGNVSAIISAVSGLSGVGIGAFLTYLKDKRAERIKDDRDSSYLAILVVSHLERFVNGCWHVALDDGTLEGRPAGSDGVYHTTTIKTPEFKPLDIEVEWKVLPRDLMYDILQIPDKQGHVENWLANPGFDDPPDYVEYFWTRQRDYAALGLEVSAVAKRLRKHARMPSVESPPGEWSRDVSLQEVIDKVDKERAEYEQRRAETSAKLPPPPPVSTTPP